VSEKNAQRNFFERADNAGRFAETALLSVILAAMILLATYQITLRNFFAAGLPWADEALRIMVLWLAMLGAVAASRDDRHISIDVMSRVLPDKPRLWLAALINAFTAVVSLTLAWFSGSFVIDSFEYAERLLGDLPAWAFQLIMPVAFFLVGYRYLVWSARRLRTLFVGGGDT